MSPSTPEAPATRRPRGWPGLSRRAVLRHVLVQPGTVRALDAAPGPGAAEAYSATATTLPLWLAANPGARVQVALSGRLLHPVLSSQQALLQARAEDRLAWARQQFVHFYGSDAATWPVALWCQPPLVVAVALHGADMAAWQAAAARHGCQIQSVQPWWAHLPDAQPVRGQPPAWPGPGAAGLLAVEGLAPEPAAGLHAIWMGFEQGRLVRLEQRRAEGAGSHAGGLVGLLQAWQLDHGIPAQATRIMAFGLQPGDALARTLALQGQLVGDPASVVPPLNWMTA